MRHSPWVQYPTYFAHSSCVRTLFSTWYQLICEIVPRAPAILPVPFGNVVDLLLHVGAQGGIQLQCLLKIGQTSC